jgi:ABC-type lipoprotein export system ATPase subunit
VLQLINIHKSWPGSSVLKGVELEIREGEIVAIVGASGSGKSTLLSIMGGLMRPTSGSVIFFEKDIYRLSENELDRFRNRNIGFIFQSYNLIPGLSLLENVMLPAKVRGEKRRDRARWLLSELGLCEKERATPETLSAGEQQRATLARALINKPNIILADEPTGSLDQENAKRAFGLLLDMVRKESRSMVVVTHNEKIVMQTDRVFELSDGILKER